MYCWLRPVFWVCGLWPWCYGCHLSVIIIIPPLYLLHFIFHLLSHSSSSSSLPDEPTSHHSMSISPQNLFSLLKSSPDDVIVLDCRPRSMFMASHPDGRKYPQWLSVPEELIRKGYEHLQFFYCMQTLLHSYILYTYHHWINISH